MEKNGLFTPSQVGALFESVRNDISVVAEKVDGLSGRMDKVEGRLESLEVEVRSIKDVVKLAIPDHTKRIKRLESKVGI